jgi:hypothetical protein
MIAGKFAGSEIGAVRTADTGRFRGISNCMSSWEAEVELLLPHGIKTALAKDAVDKPAVV